MMRLALLTILAVVVVRLVIGHVARAEPPPARPEVTVEAVLPGCRSLVATQGIPSTTEAGFCSGLIDGLMYLGSMLPADFCYAVPADVPHHQVVATIVAEIEPLYPSVRHQHLRALALDVLEYKWPCNVQPRSVARE